MYYNQSNFSQYRYTSAGSRGGQVAAEFFRKCHIQRQQQRVSVAVCHNKQCCKHNAADGAGAVTATLTKEVRLVARFDCCTLFAQSAWQ